MIPSMVSPERSLFAWSDESATAMISRSCMMPSPVTGVAAAPARARIGRLPECSPP
jgi:hypothetical protein